MRLIDKDKLKVSIPHKIAYDRYGKGFNDCIDRVVEAIDNLAETDETLIKNTNYSRFMSISVDELAEYINGHDEKLCDKICYDKTIAKNKDCPYGELEDTEKCKGCIKEWLLSEVQDG